MERFLEFYNWAESVSDHRVTDWFLIPSPLPTCVSVLMYVLFVKWIGPHLMQSRKPFNLQNALVIYNMALTMLNLYIFSELVFAGIAAGYSFPCQPTCTSNDPRHIRIAAALWWYYFSKLIEFLDTVFFVLRKKNAQISFLHVYHHATMPLLWWVGVKWVPSGLSLYTACLNSLVHVIMYTYYGMSALGHGWQKYLWWKRYLTQVQLLQFCLALGLSTYTWRINCPFPNWMYHALNWYMVSFLVLFGNFYLQAYIKKQRLYSKEKSYIAKDGHKTNGVDTKRD